MRCRTCRTPNHSQSAKGKSAFVLIERESKKVAQFEGENLNILIADATSEEVLNKAGVERARGLASCLADDAANVYVVLTARDMNKDLHIVARAIEEQAEPKLIRAGQIASSRRLSSAVKVWRARFLNRRLPILWIRLSRKISIWCLKKSPSNRIPTYIDKELKETNISSELNLLIVAIRRKDGFMILQPSADTHIREGDLLIVIGKAEPMQKLINASRLEAVVGRQSDAGFSR